MGFVFDREASEKQERWSQSEIGREVQRLQMDLTRRLIRPRRGERLLDVGCGTGQYMSMFKQDGLDVTGLDPSPAMLKAAEERLGTREGLYNGRAENLPFEDNEFDLVIMITSLEFVEDPEAALAEAIRVARRQVYIGVLNSWSLTAAGRRISGIFSENFYNRARFFSLWSLSGLVRRAAGPARIRWATAGSLPPSLAIKASSFESWPWIQQLPFGSFLGLSADIAYTMITNNLIIETMRGASPKRTPAHSPSVRGPLNSNSQDITRSRHGEVGT